MTSHSEDDMKLKRKSRPNSLYKDFQTKPREYSKPTVSTRKYSTSSEDDLPTLSPPTIKKNSSVIQSDNETDDELDNTIKVKESGNRQKLPALQNSCSNCKNTQGN